VPHHSQVSDSSGFGSGGTTVPVTVLQSSDSSCYNASQQTQIPYYFYFDPTGKLIQCGSTRIWWVPSTVNGYVPPLVCNRPSLAVGSNRFPCDGIPLYRTTQFYCAIPGGISFAIPQGTPSSANEVANNETGIGYPWTVDITAGTDVILIGSDDRGIGSGGWAPYTILSTATPDDSCLDSTSPSSTPGRPAGGSYPTSTLRSNSGGSHS